MRTEKKITNDLSYGDVISALYLGILERLPEKMGFQNNRCFEKGTPLQDIISRMIRSDEFKHKYGLFTSQPITLPDLTELYPEKYLTLADGSSIFKASSDDDFNFIESMLIKHRYYESLGVWGSEINLDTQITAAIVRGLGANSVIELGCFSGSVLSLLVEQNIDVCGIEVSHLAFLQAHANVFEKIRFGDMLDLNFDKAYDLFLGMDIIEHLNPLYLDQYISLIAQLVKKKGFVYINSPMFGRDDVFGEVFKAYLPEWRSAGENVFWDSIHCDAKGWPLHGHLIWASPKYWESAFLKHGLIRERTIEKTIHTLLAPFFEDCAPARRSFFVLKHSDSNPDVEITANNLKKFITPIIADMQ